MNLRMHHKLSLGQFLLILRHQISIDCYLFRILMLQLCESLQGDDVLLLSCESAKSM